MALREDWEEYASAPAEEKYLEVASAIYQFVEIFEFASRLAKTDIYKNGMNINIQIFKTRGRKLVLFNGLLPGNFECSNEETISCFDEKPGVVDMISNPDAYAAKAVKKTFSIFGFTWRAEGYIEGYQKKIRQGL